ncbi:MAG: endonuclease/exonuclease/phosphatase family protein [Flavipsychrobacter sp.]
MPNYSGIRWKKFDSNRKNVVEKLFSLKEGLKSIPQKTTDKNFLLATWNIREFDGNKYGNRLEESFYYIAEVISSFDMVAVQEIKGSLDPLKKVMRILGNHWDYLVSDITEGSRGNGERMAYIYDKRKVQFTSVAGEIVIPPKIKKDSNGNTVKKNGKTVYEPVAQFWRTPYLVSFQSGWFKFYLCTVHILFGDAKDLTDRTKEIHDVALFFKKRAKTENEYSSDKDYWDRQNFILLGDFNIIDRQDETFKALTHKTDFIIPAQIEKENLHGSNVNKDKFYDQIVYNNKYGNAVVTDAGIFDFFNHVYTNTDEDYKLYLKAMESVKKGTKAPTMSWYRQWRTHQMSDHLPMWVEFDTDFSQRYLEERMKS